MKLQNLSWLFVAALSVGAVVLACSSSDSSGSSGSSGTTSGGTSGTTSGGTTSGGTTSGGTTSGGTTDQCEPAAGTYTVHYEKDPTSTGTCNAPADTDATFPTDAGSADAGAGCTENKDTTACTDDVTCHTVSGSITIDTTLHGKITNGVPSGTLETKVSGSPGGVADSDCKYTITETKK